MYQLLPYMDICVLIGDGDTPYPAGTAYTWAECCMRAGEGATRRGSSREGELYVGGERGCLLHPMSPPSYVGHTPPSLTPPLCPPLVSLTPPRYALSFPLFMFRQATSFNLLHFSTSVSA